MISKKIGMTVAVILALLIGTPAIWFKYKKPAQQTVVITGLAKGQQKAFQHELVGAANQYGYIKKGNGLLVKGNFDDAIKEYQTALSLAKSKGSKGEAYNSLANVYEKKKDYKKAMEYVELDSSQYIADWAKRPIVERIKYLEHASNGEYDLAIEHAKKAMDAEASLPDSNDELSKDYVERLNDLVAAKEYILSLKNNKE